MFTKECSWIPLRERMRQVGNALATAETNDQIENIVLDNRHTIPTWAIERVFDRLSLRAMVAIVPYIPRRLYRRIPVEYIDNPVLRPLIYMRPMRDIWPPGERIQRPVMYGLYLQRRISAVQYHIGLIQGDWYTVVQSLEHLPISKTNELLRLAMTDAAALAAVTGALRLDSGRRVIHGACVGRLMALLKARPEETGDAFASYIASCDVYYRLLSCDMHYRLLACMMRLCMTNEDLAKRLLRSYYVSYLRCHSSVLFRIPAKLRLWLAYSDYCHPMGNVTKLDAVVDAWKHVFAPRDLRKLYNMCAAANVHRTLRCAL